MSPVVFGVSAWAWCTTPFAVEAAGRIGKDGGAPLLDLPPAERRRLNPLTSLALRAAETLVAGRERAQLQATPLVFGSADGDGAVLMKLLAALRAHEPLSPTQFHNSVHNTPAGYWTIALGSQAASTAIAADEETLEVALAEAGLQAVVRGGPVLMLYASRTFPPELAHVRPGLVDFAIAAWCESASAAGTWRCELRSTARTAASDSTPLATAIRTQGETGLCGLRRVSHLGGVLAIERVVA